MAPDSANGCMYLIDGHSLLFQVFHAIPEMTSPSGLPTNALYGFTRDLLYLRDEKRPDYLLCTFDRPEKTFRDDLYAEYKAHRAPIPVDLAAQLPLVEELLAGFRIPCLTYPRYEADDVIATIATAAAQRGLDVFICTSDKDCRQLLSERVRLYNLRKRLVFDRDALLQDWGIKPEQVVDLQTLVGDSVDNVRGVPGIGIKTAAKLLQEFGTIENILVNVDRVPGAKKQEALRTSGETIRLSRQLVQLATDVPLAFDWDSWRLGDWDSSKLVSLFQSWGFRSFAEQVRRAKKDGSEVGQAFQPDSQSEVGQAFQPDSQAGKPDLQTDSQAGKPDLQQGELFPFGANVEPSPLPATVEEKPPTLDLRRTTHLVNTPAKLNDFLDQLGKQKRFAIDLESTSLEPRRAEPVGYAVSWRAGEAWYLPVRGPEGEAVLDPVSTLRQLAKVLEDPGVAKINQNIKYDQLVLRAHGVGLAGVAGDPMLADYLLHAGERSHSIADLAIRYLNHQVIPITDLIGKKGKNQLRIDQVATPRVAEYSGEDADLAGRLCDLLEGKLRQAGLFKLYQDLEVPLIEVLAELEFNGIRLDVPRLGRLGEEMARQLAEIVQEIYKEAGRAFNIASPRQLRQVLFDELKLPTQRKTGITGEASTDQETLDRLAALGHTLPKKIVEHRQIAKLKGTYVEALPALVNPQTGRLHASFNQTVAATGRLSSSDPNLQNIPVRSEQGRQIRQAFLPEEGWLLLTADYSQIELRLLAHFCGDEELRRAFAEDRDIHASVAAQIFGVAEGEVTGAMRRMAKTVNFGVIYGMSAHGLALRLGIPREEAARFIDAYFARYPRVQEYQARLLDLCRRTGYVSTILGRRREIKGIRSGSTYQQRNQPEREAINMEIQGSAADLIKMAMLNLYRRLRREQRRARLLLQIHDELVLEAPPEELNAVAALVNEEMTTPLMEALRLEVPLKVDLAAGPNWLDVEAVTV